MSTLTRKPRHQSRKHRKLTTAQAILAVAEEMCATVGPTNIKLSAIAAQLGIETPSIYRHYAGLDGVNGGLAKVALQAEIDTFAGTEELPFAEALTVQAGAVFDLYVARPGIVRFLMVDYAVPGGLPGFEDEESLALVRKLFGLEKAQMDRGIAEGVLCPVSVPTYVAAKVGPAMVALSLKALQTPESDVGPDRLKSEYLQVVSAALGLAG